MYCFINTGESSDNLVDVKDSEMSIMSGLNLNVVGDILRQSTGIDNEKLIHGYK